MSIPIAIIDAFTDRPFLGNPAATTLVEQFPTAQVMQQIAAEMNLSETAFVKPIAPNHYHLRWFTPAQEVPLCGHATLAIAHDLKEQKLIDPQEPLIFSTLSGDLQISFADQLIVMDFPAAFYGSCSSRSQQIIADIFSEQPYELLGQSEEYLAVRLDSADTVQNFVPPLERIAELDGFGFIITAIASPDDHCDFVSRFFAPKAGIAEDPVTGSAHCSLTPYWAKQLNKPDLCAKQLSQRGGTLWVSDLGDRVLIKGQATTMMRGQFLIS
ncbi:MAG: PhzF family phenazine biosynthesis protein [Pseudanabaenaceae cyanobacterium bins.39]|nr:PhzF family phenazine biosynthesis protein [Pseudanabaenaceae cyanobacterium bins.39]